MGDYEYAIERRNPDSEEFIGVDQFDEGLFQTYWGSKEEREERMESLKSFVDAEYRIVKRLKAGEILTEGEEAYEYNVLETDLEDGEECVYWDWGTFAEAWKKAVDESAEEKRRVVDGDVEYRYTVIKRRKAGKWEKL